MSWLFEEAATAAVTELPAELFADAAHGRPRKVSLLEFAMSETLATTADKSAVEQPAGEDEAERLADERARTVAAMIDAAREEAREQTRASLAEAMACAEAVQRERMENLIHEFARDRERFFAAAEGQVVQLALAIAQQVLAREIAHDPLHLAGAVRAALVKVQEETGTVLRVPAAEADAWSASLASPGGAQVKVVASDTLAAGCCVLETAIGRIDLSVPVQLDEIRRGFEQVLPRRGE